MTKLTTTQAEAVRYIIRELRRRGEGLSARVYYGEGTYIRKDTAKALQRLGLVDLHVGEPYNRPAKAGFGRPANYKTVVIADRWLTITPFLEQKLRNRGVY